MNFKLYACIFTLSLAVSPALQAMRGPGKYLLMAARSMRQPLLRTGNQALMQTQSTHGKDHKKEQFKDSAYSAFEGNFMPAGAVAVGLAITAQHQMAEERISLAVEKLDIYDIKAVLEVFENGTEEDKQYLAQIMANKITHYTLENIITLLQKTAGKPHGSLVYAITKNITSYTLQQIAQILKGDAQHETHELLAHAFNAQYKHFMVIPGRLFNAQERLNIQAIDHYIQCIISLREQYRSQATANVAKMCGIDCAQKVSVRDLFALLSKQRPQIQRLMVGLFLAQNHDFNRGEIEKEVYAFIDRQRQLVYKEIAKEWNVSERKWNMINEVFSRQKKQFIKAASEAEQFEYRIEVPTVIKEMIASICKKRGVQEKMIIDDYENDHGAVAGAACKILDNGQMVQTLHLNLPLLLYHDRNNIERILEHEIGGHMRRNHALFALIILAGVKKDKTAVEKSASWQKLDRIDEYEADLISAIEDIAVAKNIRQALESNFNAQKEWSRPEPYMSNQEFYQAIMAILYLKDAAQLWFDGNEAYHLYGPPAYDKFDFSSSRKKV